MATYKNVQIIGAPNIEAFQNSVDATPEEFHNWIEKLTTGKHFDPKVFVFFGKDEDGTIFVRYTSDVEVLVGPGEWLALSNNEFHSVREDVFEATYRLVDQEEKDTQKEETNGNEDSN